MPLARIETLGDTRIELYYRINTVWRKI